MILKKLILAAAIQRLGPGPGPDPDNPNIGDYYKGGYYAGIIKNLDTGEMWRVIVSPKSGESQLRYRTSNIARDNAGSVFDGLLNTTELLTDSGHEAASYCANYSNAGYLDWYLPAMNELELIYRNFKPGLTSNSVGNRTGSAIPGQMGENANSLPTGLPYTTSSPGQTNLPKFQELGEQALDPSSYYWCSTRIPNDQTRAMRQFADTGAQVASLVATNSMVRPVRRELYVEPEPEIGDYYKGGYFAGIMKNPDTGEMWRLIVAPKSGEGSGRIKTTNTATTGTESVFDGLSNTQAMDGPAAQHCVNYTNEGYSDWYLPARDELELCYRNFKPNTISNNTDIRYDGLPMGQNDNSIPPGDPYTANNPGVTTIDKFLEGQEQAFTPSAYWTSSQSSEDPTRNCRFGFNSGFVLGLQNKNVSYPVRPVRREPYVEPEPNIGDPYKGGYFAGIMKNPDTSEMWRVIVSPKSGESTELQWKTNTTDTPGTYSYFDGLANTNAMAAAGIEDHPAAQHCVNYSNEGYNDWYMPARDEWELIYRNFKPSTESNATGLRPAATGGGLIGVNANSIPEGGAYGAGSPAQTEFTLWQSGESQALESLTWRIYWNSSQATDVRWGCVQYSHTGGQSADTKTTTVGKNVRPVRREPYTPPPGLISED